MTFSEEEIERYHIIFSRFDTDASGTIDFNELKATINDMGQYPTDDELKQMIDEVDDDGRYIPNNILFYCFPHGLFSLQNKYLFE